MIEKKTQGDLFLEIKSILEKTTSDDYELQIKPIKDKEWISIESLLNYINNLIKSNDVYRYEAIGLFEDLLEKLKND